MNKEEIIDFAKNSVEGLFNNTLDIKTYGYLLTDIEIKDNYQYEIKGNNFTWKQITDIIERNDWFNCYVQLKLDFNGNIVMKESNRIITEKNKKIDLFIDLWFKTDRIEYTYRLLDKKYKIIKDYVEQIENTNISQGVYSILNDNVNFNNKNFLQFATGITCKPRNHNVWINDFKIVDDIARISQDLEYLIGEITQLKNYIGNYISNPQRIDGKTYYNYKMTFIDKRYFYLLGVMFEILYNFWDKIGDLLAIYFTPNLPDLQIYFPKVIDNIQNPYIQSQNYIWLKNFKENEYLFLNNKRKQVVHYINIESKFYETYRSKFDNKAELLQLQEEKNGLTDILKNQFNLTISGFEKAFLLIDEIN